MHSPAIRCKRFVRCKMHSASNPAPSRVLYPFVGDSIGGSHRSAALLIRALDRTSFEPVVILHREGPLGDFLNGQGIAATAANLPYYDSSSGRIAAALNIFFALPRLVKFLRAENIALVHVNDARMSVTWALAARLARRKLIVHQRTRFARSRLPTLAAMLAQRIISISWYNLTTLPTALRARAHVIANPFDTEAAPPDRERAREALLSQSGMRTDSAVVSFVGTLQEQKRPFVFVEAAARIARELPQPVSFFMFGRDGEAIAPRIANRAKALGIAAALRCMGFRADIEQALAASDLVLAPAVNEGSGRVLVEAALAGTPVIAAASGGHGEVIADGEDGVLVPPDDSRALARAALALLADPRKRAEITAEAQKRARARYSAAKHAAEVMAIYRNVLVKLHADAALVIEGLGGGGAQHVLSTLANHWAKAGRSIAVITLTGPERDAFPLDSAVRRIVIGGADVSSNPFAALFANIGRLRALRRALRESGAPVAVGFVGSTNVLLILAALGLRLRVIVSERNDPRRQKLPGIWDRLRRLAYPLAEVVTANSAGALESLSRFVPKAKLALVPNPLREAPSSSAAAKGRPTLLAVGRLHPQKGFDILLEAFAAVRQGREDWCLVVLGEGAQEQSLKEQARRLGVDSAVEWKGFVADPFPWYRAADVFVLPSRFEGTSNALLEAMSCGVAAIASDAAGESVAHERTGLVIPAGDAPALTGALARLMDDAGLRRRLGEAARAAISAQGGEPALAAWEKIVFTYAA